jgi:hypothetical protein
MQSIPTDGKLAEKQLVQPPQAAKSKQWQNVQQTEYF